MSEQEPGSSPEPSSEDRFRLLFEQAAIGIKQVDRSGRLGEVNQALCSMLGRSREALLGSMFTDFLHPDDLAEARARHGALFAGRAASQTFEHRYRHGDGRWIWLRVTSSLVGGGDGTAPYRLSIVEDVTGRKLADGHRQLAEERYRAIVDTAVNAIAVIDEGGIIQSFNHAAEKIFGYTAAEAIGQELGLLMSEPDRSRQDRDDGADRRTGIAGIIGVGRNVSGRRKNGATFPLELSIGEWQVGGQRFFTGIMRDITERRRAEERRIADEARYRAIVDTAIVAIVVIDERGIVQSFNRAAERLFGYEAAAVVGQNVSMLMPEPQRSGHDSYIANYLRTGEAKIIGRGREVLGRRRDGSAFPIDLSIAEWSEGGKRYFTGMMRDLTEAKRAQEALHRLTETLEQRVIERTQALEAANKRLTEQMESLGRAQNALQQTQRMEAVGQLTGGIAHDFNNLLTAITGNIDLVRESTAADPELQRLLETASRAAARGARLTTQLLTFARRQTLRPELVSVNLLMQDFRLLIARAGNDAIEMEFDLAPDLWACLVDPGQLQSAILNLVVNARDAMSDQGGRLVVRSRNVTLDEDEAASLPEMLPGAYVMLTVSDTGTGMSPETVARAFEPFFTTKEVGKGTGLGLSQVYGFARQSGGSAVIESVPGAGTTVRVYLPRSVADAAAASAKRQESEDLGSGETILVVEDDPAVLATTVSILEALSYRTMIAVTAREALAALDRSPRVDLLFADIAMPGGMDGVALAKEVMRRRPGMRVLLTTGHAAHALAVDMPLINKPYERRQLAAKLREVLTSEPPKPA